MNDKKIADELEFLKFNEMFEQALVRECMQNPTPEYAAELLKLAAAHKTNSLDYPMSDELKVWLIDCAQEYASGTYAEKAFRLAKKMGRPPEKYKHIAMNAHAWETVLKGEAATYAFEATADEYTTESKKNTYETVKRAWERKNHDFGQRELCRVGLDVFLIMNNRTLTPKEEQIAMKYLKEEVSVSAIQNHRHLRYKYKDKFKFKNVNKNILNMNAEEYEDKFEDG